MRDNVQDRTGKAEEELKGFLMLDGGGRLVYRPTSLDTFAVLQSLVPHILRSDNLSFHLRVTVLD